MESLILKKAFISLSISLSFLPPSPYPSLLSSGINDHDFLSLWCIFYLNANCVLTSIPLTEGSINTTMVKKLVACAIHTHTHTDTYKYTHNIYQHAIHAIQVNTAQTSFTMQALFKLTQTNECSSPQYNTKAYTAKHSMHCQSPQTTAKRCGHTVRNVHPNDLSFVGVS